MSNLTTRVIVAAVGIPLLVWILLSGGWVLAGLVTLLSVVGVREFYSLSALKAAHPQVFLGSLIALVIPLTLQYDAGSEKQYLPMVIVASVIVVLGNELWRQKPNPLLNVSTSLAAPLYISGMLCTLILIGNFQVSTSVSSLNLLAFQSGWQGSLLLAMFITVWVCDSAAYFTGTSMGKHKIFPRVSPKKSWEGTIAGFVASPIAMWLALHFLLPEFPQTHAVVLGAIIGVVGPIGDFAESLLKRDASIKDSSALIPGHGGVLDRFDSIMFVAPVVWLYLKVVMQ